MKTVKLIGLVVSLAFLATTALADVYVNGYYKQNGTYVAPHYRSDPDGNPFNNWTYRGNTNPHTGKVGTRSYGTVNPYSTRFYYSGRPGPRTYNRNSAFGFDRTNPYGLR